MVAKKAKRTVAWKVHLTAVLSAESWVAMSVEKKAELRVAKTVEKMAER